MLNTCYNTPKSTTQLLYNMYQSNFENTYNSLNQISNWAQGENDSSTTLPSRHPQENEDEEEEQQQQTHDVTRRRQNPIHA